MGVFFKINGLMALLFLTFVLFPFQIAYSAEAHPEAAYSIGAYSAGVHSAEDDPCESNADCDLCAGEVCSNGFCVAGNFIPCKLGCEICAQEGEDTICTPSDAFCDNLAGECLKGFCDQSIFVFNNPSGCQFSHDPFAPVCETCSTCGNGICEPPENPLNQDPNNPDGCPQDCLEPGKDPGLVASPIPSCGVLDLPGAPMSSCDDADVCTDDICDISPTALIFGTCRYEPKSCSGDVADLCCPSACSGDPASGNAFDVDCCNPPATPQPTPIPTPVPSVTPVPANPGTDTNTGTPGQLWLQGSGCGLAKGFRGTHPFVYAILLLGTMSILWSSKRKS